MKYNKNQKHGPVLHYITQAKSRTTKITVMHHTLIHLNSKSVKNPYFAGADLDRFIRFAQTCQSFSQKFFLECIL